MPNQTALPQTCPGRPFARRAPDRLLALSAVLLAVGTVAACAPSSRIDVFHAGGTSAPPPQTYVMAQAANPTPDDGKAAQAVEHRLNALGWISGASTPEWKIETAYVVRANSVGAIEPETEEDAWLVQPERRPWWQRKSSIHALSVRLVKPLTGEEAGRATAHVHVAGAPAADLLDRLAQSAVASLTDDAVSPAP